MSSSGKHIPGRRWRRSGSRSQELLMIENSPLLEARAIGKSFLGIQALDATDFTLNRGEVHALLGENGAGKSTLIKILKGVYTRDSGSVTLDGTEIEIGRASGRARVCQSV